ncbi:hypothetical protein phiAS5_ORF0294 [Aeromonas phage phiAS5]|uniref:Uncharacterized protein n=1 Tax=Aeromonas phage phiAS5 TaxID=879630 RepID=E1A248_9CAUD|nr:hypothetical protein phiAS5_ORF0294 [Aeromonas phage phiAS5]ADM80137.1 hypothetical protein phiAS5_ORF0294 [Aeromonas phage phiAS5]BES53101.1 hypothetical protein [Aeromonas phage phiWae14]
MTQHVISIFYQDQRSDIYYRIPDENGHTTSAKNLVVDDLSITRDFVSFKYNGKSCYVVGCNLIAKEI